MISNIYPNMSYNNLYNNLYNNQTPIYQQGGVSSLEKQQYHYTATNNNLLATNSNPYHHLPIMINEPLSYQHQPWKLGRTGNELMLSHGIMIPNNNANYHHHPCNNNNESSLSVDSYHHQHYNDNNHYYASPPLSTSSSSTSTSIYNQGMPTIATNNSKINTHYRRSSINTSRSSSPSTSSYHESFITRLPSPGDSNKRYSCRMCNKRFTRPSSLTTHIYSHTGEKPFQCPVEGCGRNFSVVSNLRRHAKIHS